ncbi:hypothetical protein EDB85DRAFT_2219204 [Lactarius pseudohatsudake]|nr:hypothetical protein EDB85DRAFT_2219204 [Lactarius pseudohatsudake]
MFNEDKELRTGLWKVGKRVEPPEEDAYDRGSDFVLVGFMKHLPNLLKQESSSAATIGTYSSADVLRSPAGAPNSTTAVFYRSAGPPTAPVLLLLHGFPSSSSNSASSSRFSRQNSASWLLTCPAFGFTEVPAERKYQYTFDNLSLTIEGFPQRPQGGQIAVYIFDYGSPTAFRIAVRHPRARDRYHHAERERVRGGARCGLLGAAREVLGRAGVSPRHSHEAQALLPFLQLGPTKWQYTHGVPEALLPRIAPEAYLARRGAARTRWAAGDAARAVLRLSHKPEALPALAGVPSSRAGVPVLALWGRQRPHLC